MSTLKIGVVSDLHCKYRNEHETFTSTFLYSNEFPGLTKTHPISALEVLIDKENLQVDIVLCPGDISDKADDQGLITGWGYLEKIRKMLKATSLLASVGNHDIGNRDVSNKDPFYKLKYLDRNYPTPDKSLNDKFWSKGFCLFENGEYAVLLFNSSWSHVNVSSAYSSSITQAQLDEIEEDLSKLTSNIKFKFFLCHHHVLTHSNVDYSDTDFIDKGDKLIALLNQFKFQIVIHGHKHDPRLTIQNSLPIFCSGSFSSRMNLTETGAENTFHIIELEPGVSKGTIKSWSLSQAKGWIPKLDSYFPFFIGFGYNGDLKHLADNCKSLLNGKNVLYFNELLMDIPEIAYLSPTQQEDFSSILKSDHKLVFSPSFPNTPNVITEIYE